MKTLFNAIILSLLLVGGASADFFCDYLAQEGGNPITVNAGVVTIHLEVLPPGIRHKRIHWFNVYKKAGGGAPVFTGDKIRATPGSATDTYTWTDDNYSVGDEYEVWLQSGRSHTHIAGSCS